MFIQSPRTFTLNQDVHILAENEDLQARWHSGSGAIAIVDIESGFVINDAYPIFKDKDKAIAKAKRMMGVA